MAILSSSLHDPHGGLTWMLPHVATLQTIFDKVIVTATASTSDALLSELRRLGVAVAKQPKDTVGLTYRATVRHGYAAGARTLFLLDFDRALHWARTRPEELARAAKQAERHEWFIGERTPRAYRSHHLPLYKTEQEPNRIIAAHLGEQKPHDYLSSCVGLSRGAQEAVLAAPTRRDLSLFGLWPLTLKKAGYRPTYVPYEGLEWETADQNQEKVKTLGGVVAFRKSLDNPAEWEKRERMAAEFVRDYKTAP